MATQTPTRNGQKAKAAKAAESPRALAKRLNTQSRKFFDLTKRGDFRTLARLTTKDFSFIDERGAVAMAGSCVADFESIVSNPDPTRTSLKVKSFEVGDAQTRVYGDTAIETLLYSDNVSVKNKGDERSETFNRSFRITNVWVKQGDDWQLASTQLTPIRV